MAVDWAPMMAGTNALGMTASCRSIGRGPAIPQPVAEARSISEHGMENDAARADPDRRPVGGQALGDRGRVEGADPPSRHRRSTPVRRAAPRVTQRMLTQHLREPEADGIPHREVRARVPPHVEYPLTAEGRTPVPILDAVARRGRADDAASP